MGDVPLLELRNLSLLDSGSRDVMLDVKEAVKGQGPALFGSFQLSIDGHQTEPIAYDATETEMLDALRQLDQSSDVLEVARSGPFLNKAFEWRLTFGGYPDRVRTIAAISADLSGGAGAVIPTLLSPGAKSEQVEITTSLTSGAFTCSANLLVTSAIAFDTSATDVAAAFEASGFGRTTVVIGPAGTGSWTVTFVDWTGDLPMLDCGANQTVTEVAAGTGLALSGSFRLSYEGEWTSLLQFNASATDIEAALNALGSLDDVVVLSSTGSGVGDVNGGGT